jgi:hypothetical protein
MMLQFQIGKLFAQLKKMKTSHYLRGGSELVLTGNK